MRVRITCSRCGEVEIDSVRLVARVTPSMLTTACVVCPDCSCVISCAIDEKATIQLMATQATFALVSDEAFNSEDAQTLKNELDRYSVEELLNQLRY